MHKGLFKLFLELAFRILIIASIVCLGFYTGRLFEALLLLVSIAQFELAYRQWWFSRLSRRQKTLIDFLYDCVEADITIYSIKESYFSEWLRDPRARTIIIGLLSILYDLERQLISERTKAGIEKARAMGKRVGRPRKEIDMGKVKELFAKGYPLSWVARELGVSVSTIKRRLRELQLSK